MTLQATDLSSDEILLAVPHQTSTLPQANQAKHVPAGTGTAYWGPGELMTFLITGEETGGAFFMAELSVAPGGGTPPHIHHREDEAFRLLEGTLTIQVGGDTITLHPPEILLFFPVESLIRSRTPATAMPRRWS
jgi:quercetin dioxygenase-like cupin family protein